RLGDRSGALRAYEAFADRLRREWEMDPGDELKALVDDIDTQPTLERDQSAPEDQGGKSEPAETAVLDSSHFKKSPRTAVEPGIGKPAISLRPGTARPHWWVAAAGLLLIIIVAGWMLWSGVSGSGSTSAAVTEHSLAVLPFSSLGIDDSTDYFSLGMTEEILSRLAQVSDLSVISRTS